MAEVDVPVLVNYDDDELDQLLRNVQLEETNDGGGNGNDDNLHANSQAPLFEAVWSPTNEMRNGKAGLAPDERRGGERHQEGGPRQRPALLTPTKAQLDLTYTYRCKDSRKAQSNKTNDHNGKQPD